MQKVVIAGGTGLIGQALIAHWLTQSCAVTVISRSADKIHRLFGNRVRAVEWKDLAVTDLQTADAVVNLTGAGIAGRRWTAAQKQRILDSRLTATNTIVSLLTACGAEVPVLLNASAIGVYGLQSQTQAGLPPPLDESTPIDWQTAPDFLAIVARAWEKATHRLQRVVNLRFGVVLSTSGGALPKMALPFFLCLGGPVGTGQQPFSWVMLEDVVRAIDFILQTQAATGPINIVSPGAVTQRAFAKSLGRVLRRPAFMPTPAWLLKLALGEMATELLLEGQHVVPGWLQANGFTFLYPDVGSALEKLYR